MNEEAKKPVVEAPQIVSASQAQNLDKAAKLYAEGKKKRAEAEDLIVKVLGKEPTLPQVQNAKAYFVQALKKESTKLDSSIITEVDRLFRSVMEFNKIPYPKAKTKTAVKTAKSREANDKAEAERLRKKGLLEKSLDDLQAMKLAAFNKASTASTQAEEDKAEADIADIKSAKKILEAKQNAADKEDVKVSKAELRAVITEENRLVKLKKRLVACKNISSE